MKLKKVIYACHRSVTRFTPQSAHVRFLFKTNFQRMNIHHFILKKPTNIHKSIGIPKFIHSEPEWQPTSISNDEYHAVADETMERLTDYFEALGDEIDLTGMDVECTQGVLTLKLGQHGTYVINKQPPNKQIWLSSPKSGPKRFDWDGKRWVYYRDQSTMDDLLNGEISEALQMEINVNQ
jgi:frataxin